MQDEKDRSHSAKRSAKRLEHEAEGAAAGAVAGAVVGAAAGPPGAIAGAILGGAAGAMAGRAMDAQASADMAHTCELDAEIGVSEGDIGAPNLKHPPAEIGAYSSASAGAGVPEEEAPAEGPLQPPRG
jgi:hypothetical protein